MTHSRLLLTVLLTLPSVAHSGTSHPADDPLPWAAPQLERSVAVRDGRTGELLSFDALLDSLATADAVFLGETHIDETTHRVELAVLQGLAKRRLGKVVLAMEMFERDVQPALDAYLVGASSEAEFLAAARPWGNYITAYRPMIEFAKASGLPVVASNFPKALSRKLARMGDGATLDALDGEVRQLVPDELFANSPAYWRRVDNAIRGHIGMMGIDPEDEERLFSTQSLWDNSMGEACAKALEEYPQSSVLHVNGGFHSAYWDGTVRQLRLRQPDAKVLTVAINATANPSVADPGGAPVADYVVYTEARGRDINEGSYAVSVERKIEYRFHLPPGANAENKVPLLIWLTDDGFAAKDGMALLRARFGDECALAVVEAPYRETQEDLMVGGRWYWPDSFASDVGTVANATDKIWAYLLRYYPIDPARVCIAGEGTGATVVSHASLAGRRMGATALAFSPRRYSKLRDIPLPLPEFRGADQTPEKSLRLFLDPQDTPWWTSELSEYAGVGFDCSMVEKSTDPWLVEREQEVALRGALGLEQLEALADAPRRHILVDNPRGRFWARLLAVEETKQDGALVAILETAPAMNSSSLLKAQVGPSDYANGTPLPRCPGPFGGTTVLVLPESTSAEVAEAWFALEASDPLNAKSRFHRLRIATEGGAADLSKVLGELEARGRKNVLIIPATFCADGEDMRSLRRASHQLEDKMTVRWRPGLGG